MKLEKPPLKKHNILTARAYPWVVSVLIGMTTLSAYSGTAYAGLFSFLSPIVEGEPVSAQTIVQPKSNNLQTLALLQAAVNMDPNPNKTSELIPIAKGEVLIADIANSNEIPDNDFNTTISTYTVRPGDTISGVAHMFNVSINTVLWANDLTGKSILKPGQTLIILPVSGISYEIAKGDTVSTIAKKYNADVNDILNYNDITLSTKLSVGYKILIPDAELSQAQIATKRNNSNASVVSNDGRNYPSYTGYYIRPIVGGHESQGIHGHNAVDLAAPVGTEILASASGRVIISKNDGLWHGGYGNYVVISHPNGTQTLYAHMLKTAVSAGDVVSRGEIIGYIGMTGHTTGPHVHFEIRGAKNPF
ncbi:MAG: peptidoglycan DD-metalloendopeptidase family protein [Patescibacteria group bacterium]|nr:peptidoglycan DD-metalloendopeptidase family protein [Patescibacteria group bacterium]